MGLTHLLLTTTPFYNLNHLRKFMKLQISGIDSLDAYPSIKKYREYSIDKLTTIREKLKDKFGVENSFSLAVAGSYGRLEASLLSDFDYIFLFENKPTNFEEIESYLLELLKDNKIVAPNPTGVFSKNLTISEMISDIGGKKDSIFALAQRILLLMECKCIYNEQHYQNIINGILEKYLDYVIKDPFKEAIFLLNDTIRYFRSICVSYENSFINDNSKWVLRNVKLRHSRVIMYAGLLFLILNASKRFKGVDTKLAYIKDHINETPLEKIIGVYQENNDLGYKKVLGLYDFFLKKINDETTRTSLQADYSERHQNPIYLELKVTSENLQTELTRFIFSPKNNWTERIYEYLIF